MSVLIGTFLALALCALVFGLRIMMGTDPLEAGCRRAAGERCDDCRNREQPGKRANSEMEDRNNR